MSVLDNLLLAPTAQVGETVLGALFRRRRMAEQERALRAKAEDILDFVTLSHLVDHPAGKISGGQMKLLEPGRALMGDPSVILLDEPPAGLSPKIAGEVLDLARRLTEQGVTVLLVEQTVKQALRVADHCYILAEGRNQIDGPAAQIASDPVVGEIYLGGKRMEASCSRAFSTAFSLARSG